MDEKSIVQLLNLNITNFQKNIESQAYQACSFIIDDKIIEFRTAKITPTKSGQFVTFWKRSTCGLIIPFDIQDNIDFFIVHVKKKNLCGLFIFSKSILVDKNIISVQGIGGKRAIRVYSSWDKSYSKQAIKT